MKTLFEKILNFLGRMFMEAFACTLLFYPIYFTFMLGSFYFLQLFGISKYEAIDLIGGAGFLAFLYPVFPLAMLYCIFLVSVLEFIDHRENVNGHELKHKKFIRSLLYIGFVVFFILIIHPYCEQNLCYI